MKLTAAYKKVGDCWAAWVEEIPGVNTQGATLEEARENLKDALRMVLEANQLDARTWWLLETRRSGKTPTISRLPALSAKAGNITETIM
jgi:predicted RNase H-like HicB family nuclease